MCSCSVQSVLQLLVLVLFLQCCWSLEDGSSSSGRQPEEPETWTKTVLEDLVPPTVITAQACPGVVGSKCTRKCQLRTCQALASLYRVSNNASDPWDYEHGWKLTTQQSCQQLLSDRSEKLPVYCSWHGVTCCDAGKAAEDRCFLINSVSALNLATNNINASLQNPELFRALKELHDCGMSVLNAENNNLVGSLTDEWGQLHHLRYLNLATGWLNGVIPEGLRKMHNLTVLHLGNNWLNGTLPQWIPELKLLRVVNLGSQFGDNQGTNLTGLLGRIPPRIGGLSLLRELVLEANSLSGPLPDGLCKKDTGSLLVLNVRSNMLEGSAKEVEDCQSLIQLDISHNKFTGSLPASAMWEQLATYTASHNSFSGSWPPRLSEARILQYLDISHNSITGLIPPQVTLISSLISVKLDNNKFSGTVVEDLYFLPALAVLDLSNNLFVGTTPVSIGLSYSLTELDLSNNTGITGMMPPAMGLLPRIQVVRLTQTNMSCAGITKPYVVTTNQSCSDPAVCKTPQQYGDPAAPISRCSKDALLPCFLHFGDYLVPREDSSNMKCKVISRKPAKEAQEDCSGSGPQQLGGQASTIPNTARGNERWDIDPWYYQYQACECLLGFTGSWDSTGTMLTCVPEQKSSQLKGIIIAVVVAAAAVLAVAFAVWRQYLRTRPRWLRERTLQSKRSKGAPKASKPGDKVLVSILVTDVKDFSALTRRYPELMNRAMGGHNNMMRKACHAHAGHVMDQEGDSWTVAFHDAEDAVAFGLQVQQALAGKVWGIKLAPDYSTRPQMASPGTFASDESTTSSYGMMGPGTAAAALIPPAAAAGGGWGRPFVSHSYAPQQRCGSSLGSEGCGSSLGRAGSIGASSLDCSFTSAQGAQQPGNTSKDLELGMTQVPEAATGAAHAPSQAGASGFQHGDTGQDAHQPMAHLRSSHAGDIQAARDSIHHQQQGLGDVKATSSRRWLGRTSSPAGSCTSQQSGPRVAGYQTSRTASRLYSAGSMLIHRLSRAVRSNIGSSLLQPLGADMHMQELQLSVRIGIATGWLEYGGSLDHSVVKERAKNFISDVANGGQVLMDEHTFKLVKHSLSALGTVDENGYNDKQLQQMMQAQVVAKIQRHVACGAGCISRGARGENFSSLGSDDAPRDYDTDTMVVHMGGFTAPVAGPGRAGLGDKLPTLTSTSDDSTRSAEDDSCDEPPPAVAVPADPGPTKTGGRARRGRRGSLDGVRRGSKAQCVHLQLYSVAAPGMRRPALHTQELTACTAWCQPVRCKPGWVQVQKDYFQAPGARAEDLSASGQQGASNCSTLPPVTFVFAEVPGAQRIVKQHHSEELHVVNRAIRRCMLQLMADLPGGDGYMCRCHEPDLKYMVAFESPVRAVQWCLLLQEALMFMAWPEDILQLPGFEPVVDPESGQLLFRGPRLRMGVSEGLPSSVIPDHMGHANYTGGVVNRAARFMDVAAHPGQVVCDIQLAQRCFKVWPDCGAGAHLPGRQSWGSGLDALSPEPIPEAAAATDWGDPQVSLMQLMALRSQSETSGHCRPATGLQGLRSRALHELWYQQQQLKQEQKELYRKQVQQQQGSLLPQQPWGPSDMASNSWQHGGGHAVHGGSSASGRRLPSIGDYMVHDAGVVLTRQGLQPSGASFTRYSPFASGGAAAFGGVQGRFAPVAGPSSTSELVTASFIGTFSFKGSGAYEMVQLQHKALLHRQFPTDPPKGKGMRLSLVSGPVCGLPLVQLHIPARVLAAREAWARRLNPGVDRE